MKKLYLILLSVILFCCDSEKKELVATYNDFTKRSDSIAEVHDNFEARHDAMKAKYAALQDKIQNMENKDSLLLADLREQGLLIERHDAILLSHAEVIEAHQNSEPDFESMDALMLNEKIDEMQQWHQRMQNDHEILKEEHDRMETIYINLERRMERNSVGN